MSYHDPDDLRPGTVSVTADEYAVRLSIECQHPEADGLPARRPTERDECLAYSHTSTGKRRRRQGRHNTKRRETAA